MKIFISWSGYRSKLLAEAFKENLQIALQFTDPFLSDHDTEPGLWGKQLDERLEGSRVGIFCLTKENLEEPWIHYEAGAIAKKVDEGYVIPILLDCEINELPNNLSRFQSYKCSEHDLLKILSKINEIACGEHESSIDIVGIQKIFSKMFWPDFSSHLKEIPDSDYINPKNYFTGLHDGFGLKNIFESRGSSEIRRIYNDLIVSSKDRVWAIGRTNRSFIRQNTETILDRCENVPDLDVRIAFWNPKTTMNIDGITYPIPINDIQEKLEANVFSSINWERQIMGRRNYFIQQVKKRNDLKGRIRIYYLSVVANISCFIIDNNTFFFPFLAAGESSLDPHMWFSSGCICEHICGLYNELFEMSEFCEIVFDSKINIETDSTKFP